MLYVPPHWWHFVENLETSISVNAWFPHVSYAAQKRFSTLSQNKIILK